MKKCKSRELPFVICTPQFRIRRNEIFFHFIHVGDLLHVLDGILHNRFHKRQLKSKIIFIPRGWWSEDRLRIKIKRKICFRRKRILQLQRKIDVSQFLLIQVQQKTDVLK